MGKKSKKEILEVPEYFTQEEMMRYFQGNKGKQQLEQAHREGYNNRGHKDSISFSDGKNHDTRIPDDTYIFEEEFDEYIGNFGDHLLEDLFLKS